MANTQKLLIRGLSKAQKNSLKRQAKAKDKRASVNSFVLQILHDHTIHDIASFEIKRKERHQSKQTTQ